MYEAKTILVVTSDPNLLRSLELLIRQSGYRVRTAPNLATADQQVEADFPAMVLLDTKIPGSLPPAKELALRAELERVAPGKPVLMLVAGDLPAGKTNRAPLRRLDALQKPVDPQLLIAKIGQLLAESPA